MTPEMLKTCGAAELTVMLLDAKGAYPAVYAGADVPGFMARDWRFLEVRDGDVYVYGSGDAECYVLRDESLERWVVAFDY